jgi:cobalt-zinc-cadmium efflux system outer membrane protein
VILCTTTIMNSTSFFQKLFFLFYLLITPLVTKANASTDTLHLNLAQADSLFLRNSYYLLAAACNISAQKAQILQAKIYPLPNVTADFNAYDPENNKLFHIGKTGQMGFEIEQLIILGGKRKSEIEMAQTNAAIAELSLTALTQQLKFTLHQNLFLMGQQSLLLIKYNEQLDLLSTLLEAYQTQANKGNIALKEVVRLKGAYLKLNNDRSEVLSKYHESLTAVQKIIQVNLPISFIFQEQDIEAYIKPTSLDDIIQKATNLKPEILLGQQQLLLANQNLAYQKKQNIPDLTTHAAYDQRSGAFNNQINIGISLPLPLWNKNKGNITSAQSKIQQAQYEQMATQHEMVADINSAYTLYQQTVKEYIKSKTLYNADFDITIKGMSDNFIKRNISIIEFIDFFEAYNEAINEMARIKTQLVTTAENINLLSGTIIY